MGQDRGGSQQRDPGLGLSALGKGLAIGLNQSAHGPSLFSWQRGAQVGREGSEGRVGAGCSAHACVDRCTCGHTYSSHILGGEGVPTMNKWASQRGVYIFHQRLGNRGTGLQCLRGVWVTLFVFVCVCQYGKIRRMSYQN